MKKYVWMSSAVAVIGALRVKTSYWYYTVKDKFCDQDLLSHRLCKNDSDHLSFSYFEIMERFWICANN